MPPIPAATPPPEDQSHLPVTSSLTRSDLIMIAAEANLLKLFGKQRVRSITLDYVPPRPAMVIPRLAGEEPITALPPHIEEITYNLEDTMFGGEVFTAVTSRSFVIVSPWLWSGWEVMTGWSIIPPR